MMLPVGVEALEIDVTAFMTADMPSEQEAAKPYQALPGAAA